MLAMLQGRFTVWVRRASGRLSLCSKAGNGLDLYDFSIFMPHLLIIISSGVQT